LAEPGSGAGRTTSVVRSDGRSTSRPAIHSADCPTRRGGLAPPTRPVLRFSPADSGCVARSNNLGDQPTALVDTDGEQLPTPAKPADARAVLAAPGEE
jgi:hypothetical protein